jgi:DNA-binding transcriptional regulator YiaG
MEADLSRRESMKRSSSSSEFLKPDEYKMIREARGCSQQYLADLLGVGVATVSRTERGRFTPPRSYDKALRVIRDCPGVWEYLKGLLDSGGATGTPKLRGNPEISERSSNFRLRPVNG